MPIKYRTVDGRRRMAFLAELIKRSKSFAMAELTDDEQREDARWMWRNSIVEISATPEGKGMRYSVTGFGHDVLARSREIYAEDALKAEAEGAAA